MAVLLVAAALAGCTGGTSNDEGQLPDETPTGGSDGSQTRQDRGPDARSQRGSSDSYDAYLEVSADNGTAPLNLTLTFGATWQDNGQRGAPSGNGTAGSSANRTSSGPAANGTGSGNATGASGNGTGNDGSHPVNGGHDVTWTIEVRLVSPASGNGTTGGPGGNSTGGGNAAGNGTVGNSTSSGTTTSSGTSTSTAPAGNQTGNGTSSQTNTTGNGGTGNGTTGNGTAGDGASGAGNGTSASGTLIVSFNGTGADLPGNETVLLNETGTYEVTFTVTPDDGSPPVIRNAAVTVEPLPPGTPLGNETKTFEGSTLAAAPLICGAEEFGWLLNDTFAGHDADVSRVNLTLESNGFGEWEMTLVAPNGTEVGTGPEISADGPFAPGNYTLTVENCLDVEASFTVTAVAHYATRGGFE